MYPQMFKKDFGYIISSKNNKCCKIFSDKYAAALYFVNVCLPGDCLYFYDDILSVFIAE